MTIRQALERKLYEHGLFEDQAKAIVAQTEADAASDPMKGRWDDAHDDYPPQVLALAWVAVKFEAGKWLDEHMPMHWARGVFPAAEEQPAPVEPS